MRRVRSLFKRAPLEDVPLDLNDVIRDVLRLVEADTIKRHVALSVSLDPGVPVIRGDRVQLQQLLWNLTMNAIDAVTPVLNRSRHVSVQTLRTEQHVVIEVGDNGVGLTDLEAVFEPFFTTKPEGLGMGLTICRSIATAHGAHLSAARNAEGGTTFSFVMALTSDALT